MQSAEEFMRVYFRSRTDQIKTEIQNRQSFRAEFFTDGCVWDSRKNEDTRSEAESIVSVSGTDSEAAVITQPASPFPKFRYHLRKETQRWLIRGVDIECQTCDGTGANEQCPVCQGSGWLETDKYMSQARIFQQRAKSATFPGHPRNRFGGFS